MEFLENILPFLIFVFILANKSRKRVKQTRKVTTIDNRHGQRKNLYNEQNIRQMRNWKKIDFIEQKDVINSQEIDGKDIIDEYANQQIATPADNMNMSDGEMEEGVKDIIHENEIGKQQTCFDKQSIIRGIIMSEILGKPKALK